LPKTAAEQTRRRFALARLLFFAFFLGLASFRARR
jgi:hypothetical protein